MSGLALYRISTAVSRGMKVMQTRYLLARDDRANCDDTGVPACIGVGFGASSPEVAANHWTAASGLIAARARLNVVSPDSGTR